jgi:hypothetical protein
LVCIVGVDDALLPFCRFVYASTSADLESANSIQKFAIHFYPTADCCGGRSPLLGIVVVVVVVMVGQGMSHAS